MSRSFEIKRVSPAIGAEVIGLDISKHLDDDVIAELRSAWLEHLVLFFRGQALEPADQMGFAKRFGEPDLYPMVKGLPDFPEITPVLKKEDETVNFGGLWHSDTSYLETPPMAAMLYAIEIPPVGGDTMWSNMYAAYDALSDGLKETLDGLTGVSSSAKADVTKTREDRVAEAGTDHAVTGLEAHHPVIRTHPETGRKGLYVNSGHTVRFDGWTEEESAPLLSFLFDHLHSDEFVCRFQWSKGALAFWDNRVTQHYPLNDYHGYRRLMHRVSIKGDKPV